MAAVTTEETSAAAPGTTLHRVKVLNLPSHESAAIKKFFRNQGIERYKKAPNWRYAYLTFEVSCCYCQKVVYKVLIMNICVNKAEGPAKEAMQKLEGVEFKKRALTTEYSTINKEVYRARFQAKTTKENAASSSSTTADNDTRSPAERLADQVTPLHR